MALMSRMNRYNLQPDVTENGWLDRNPHRVLAEPRCMIILSERVQGLEAGW